MSERIVLATRYGPSAAAPAEVAADLAHRIGATITLVYVAPELAAIGAGGGEAGIDPHEERDRTLADIHAGLREFVDRYLAHMSPEVRICEGGDVAEEVTSVARETGAAYLVVGTRERGPLARLILGDTTHAILQRTPCPVVVVPLHDSPES